MSLFEIPEIELIIFTYLDNFDDWSIISLINKKYKRIIDDMSKFTQIFSLFREYNFDNLIDQDFFFVAKYLHHHNDNIFVTNTKLHNQFLEIACYQGRFDMVKWLLKMNNKIDIDASLFMACRSDNLDIAKCLLETNSIINIDGFCAMHLPYLLDNRCFKVAKWLIDLNEDFSIIFKEIFLKACKVDNFDIIKLLVEKRANIDIHVNNNALKIVCKNGNLELIKWFLGRFNNVDIELIFEESCVCQKIKIAKWLYEKYTFDYDYLVKVFDKIQQLRSFLDDWSDEEIFIYEKINRWVKNITFVVKK